MLSRVLSGFTEFGADGSIVRNTEFGTFEKLRDVPLTVRYRLDPRAVWSDGVPIDCDDLALAWLANSGVTGMSGFNTSGTIGYRDMDPPVCGADRRIATVTYRRPFADWQTMFSSGSGVLMPAHVVERQSGMTRKLSDYLANPRSPDLSRAITFYNKGWVMTPGRVNRSITPASGPYQLDSWVSGQSITLKANPRWWGAPPRTGTVVIRFIAGSQQVQALANGEIQIMDPKPQVDIVRQAEALGDTVNLKRADRFDFEHLDFSFNGVFRDRTLREAFALCVPRQEIVDKLVKPVSPSAGILQSRFVMPFQPAYARFATGGGGHAYDRVDIAAARHLLAGRTPTVRLGWSRDPTRLDRRRVDTVALIQASCAKAGFRVVDAGSPTFLDKEWVDGAFDVALFAWTGSSALASQGDIYVTDGASNVTGYSNARVDALWAQYEGRPDASGQAALLQAIDAALWSDLATIPLFNHPALLVTSRDVDGVQYNPTAGDVAWSMPRWSRG